MHEVVDGELVVSPKNNFQHGDICVRLRTALHAFASARKLGVVLDSGTGFWMRNRNCRAPDVSFIDKARLHGWKRAPVAFFEGAPDRAVEILAPSNTPSEITARLADFFASGTKLAWIIHPEERFVEICRAPTQRRMLGVGALLEGESVLPGFEYPIADLFKEWDWD